MRIRGYYLDIREFLETQSGEALWAEALGKVDAVRRQKAKRCGRKRAGAASLGAGLLLQLLAQEEEARADGGNWNIFTVREILGLLGTPRPLTYRYGEKGKPYFADSPWYFSLSHSGDYVLCVWSKEEMGADLQKLEDAAPVRLAKRFFAPAEYEAVRDCGGAGAAGTLFFDLWTKKEAWGKLTGLGLAAVLGKEVRPKGSEPGRAEREESGQDEAAQEAEREESGQGEAAQEAERESGPEGLPEWLEIPTPAGYAGVVCRRSKRPRAARTEEKPVSGRRMDGTAS